MDRSIIKEAIRMSSSLMRVYIYTYIQYVAVWRMPILHCVHVYNQDFQYGAGRSGGERRANDIIKGRFFALAQV